jgi:glycosyltransferase involved in cell wall biosynthesis
MSIFHKHKTKNPIEGPVKLVTHHWSKNPKKGFDIYDRLQKYINETEKYEFTYIGRKPEGYDFVNYIPPISAEQIAKELPSHHIYITASIEEAGANHVLEAMACGLPLVFHEDGGSIVNYCKDYGLSFASFDEMISQIDKMVENYETYKTKVLSYDEDNTQVTDAYLQVITNL